MAHGRHKRETRARWLPRAAVVAGPVAGVATLSAVAAGVFSAKPAIDLPDGALFANATGAAATADRDPILSRDERRQSARASADQQRDNSARVQRLEEKLATADAVAAALRDKTERWTTAPLNLWATSEEKAKLLGEIDEGEKVLVTGRSRDGRVEIVVERKSRWVTQGYLSVDKPLVATLGGSCSNGTSVAGGVSANIVKVHQAVCAAFPSITVYGTIRGGGGDHPLGRAVDIMVSGSLGQQVADFVRANAAELGVSYVIYAQRIWSVERGGEGWRGMSSRGSATANHYDHVHVSTF